MSFLSRLAGGPDERVVDAVSRNIEAVLNAKQGYAGGVEVFGLGSYEGRVVDKTLFGALMVDMIEQVRRYEPRLREPRLTFIGRDHGLWARFSLSGRMDGSTRTFAVLVHSVFRNVRVLSEPR